MADGKGAVAGTMQVIKAGNANIVKAMPFCVRERGQTLL